MDNTKLNNYIQENDSLELIDDELLAEIISENQEEFSKIQNLREDILLDNYIEDDLDYFINIPSDTKDS